MKFIKVKGSKNMDIKSKMLREYADPVKGRNYRNIDLERIEKEQQIKHMPISQERLTYECKNDIALCKNYNELKV